ncbi:MAG: S46 family peptidase [Thermoanaerobaculia bacterium]
MKRLIAVLILVLPAATLLAEEGMWTLDNFPTAKIQATYGVEIDDAWLARIQRATTRIEGGCTGSFVSPDGLVLTNHHCVRRCTTQISSAENNVDEEGFLASNRSEEVQCESEQLSVLVEVEEITAQVMGAIEGKADVEANEIRKQTLTRMEQACEDASLESATGKLSCETVSLYNGGQYFLYKYKRYDDVRLVFVPEAPIAAFGGDPDNFNFPRWCLDMSFLRAYENGEPAKTPDYLTWRAEGAKEGELVFVTGHPGSTDRQLTVAELKTMRDVSLPHYLMRYAELRGRYIQFGKTGEEPYRIVQGPLLMTENGIKVRRNELRALLDDEIFARKLDDENRLREAVAADPQLAAKYGSAWDDIAAAEAAYLTFRDEYLFLEAAVAFRSTLFDYARSLVRAAEERQKPNEQRLREYTEAALPQLRQRTLASRPIYPDLEEVDLSFSLDKLREFLGPDSPYVKKVLGRVSPDTLAHALVAGTRLGDAGYREKLWDGGMEAIEASQDPMILFVRKVDPISRAYRKRYEDEVEAPEKQAAERIAEARFVIQGASNYPDATFTLRVTFGSVKGWEEKGEMVTPFTTVGGIFPRVTGDDPFRLPASWLEAQQRLDPDTRFNFVATTDITGGNSGSPAIDKQGNLVGLVFDGNIHSIAGSYWFDESVNRTVSVHPAVMLEALEKIYKANHLVEELSAK